MISGLDLIFFVFFSHLVLGNASIDSQTNLLDTQRQVMSFVLPSKFTMESVPKPTNPKVTLREQPGEIVLSQTFSGLYDHPEVLPILKKLVDEFESENNKSRDSYRVVKNQDNQPVWRYARYNPPWTLPMWRKNEIFVKLEKTQ